MVSLFFMTFYHQKPLSMEVNAAASLELHHGSPVEYPSLHQCDT